MLKKSANCVLASRRFNVWIKYALSPRILEAHRFAPVRDLRLLLRRLADLVASLPAERRVFARLGRAGENSNLFEHSEDILAVALYGQFQLYCPHQPSFSAAC